MGGASGWSPYTAGAGTAAPPPHHKGEIAAGSLLITHFHLPDGWVEAGGSIGR